MKLLKPLLYWFQSFECKSWLTVLSTVKKLYKIRGKLIWNQRKGTVSGFSFRKISHQKINVRQWVDLFSFFCSGITVTHNETPFKTLSTRRRMMRKPVIQIFTVGICDIKNAADLYSFFLVLTQFTWNFATI